MADAPKVDWHVRLAELRAENELLRQILALQCDDLRPTLARAEQGFALAQMGWQNRGLVSSALRFFSRSKKSAAEDLTD